VLERLFAAGGPLARAHPAYRERPAQLVMAQGVEEVLARGGTLVCEAGTGTGKSLGYLVPAALSGRRVVVSTATLALQSQLLRDDLPLAAAARGKPIRAELLKGRSNYACRRMVVQLGMRLFDPLHGDAIERLRPWLDTTLTGDRAELDHEPPAGAWSEVAVGPERCLGARCTFSSTCFAEEARERAADADVIIVNHALYFADLGLRIASDGAIGVLPEHDAVIFDEAHELEDAAAEWLGARLSLRDVTALRRDCERACRLDNATVPGRLLHDLESAAHHLFARLPAARGRTRLGEPELRDLAPREAASVRHALGSLTARLGGMGEERDVIARRAERLRVALDACLGANHEQAVVWSERGGGGPELRSAPISVAPLLREHLWDRLHAAVLTSATLSLDGDLSFTRARLGLASSSELVLASPFDVRAQALLYLPRDAPDPRAAGWDRAIADHIIAIVRASEGRALCLFTSWRALEAVRQLVAEGLSAYPLLVQGEAPRERLLEAFRADVHSVLLATQSFWQGVDVRGEACSCVIIDRLPFAVPSDPLVAGRCEQIVRDGGSAFDDYALPQAALMLRQGFGRLLRSHDDRGVVAVLDGRLSTARYAEPLLAALPAVPRVHEIADVEAFFGRSVQLAR
jgi:ATP-dependent DNA helicase DinG